MLDARGERVGIRLDAVPVVVHRRHVDALGFGGQPLDEPTELLPDLDGPDEGVRLTLPEGTLAPPVLLQAPIRRSIPVHDPPSAVGRGPPLG